MPPNLKDAAEAFCFTCVQHFTQTGIVGCSANTEGMSDKGLLLCLPLLQELIMKIISEDKLLL